MASRECDTDRLSELGKGIADEFRVPEALCIGKGCGEETVVADGFAGLGRPREGDRNRRCEALRTE
jgi:hypothetical protein